ncbi:MAG: RNA-binding protein [Campylobacterales bacterium]|nr:RNA-binding protein [Campylobacterales bacterium]
MNIYVGNLSYHMTEEELKATFAPYGAVKSAKIVVDRENNNRSKGFGFVEMESQSEGNAAIEQLNGKEIGGRELRVNEARPREPRESRGSRY